MTWKITRHLGTRGLSLLAGALLSPVLMADSLPISSPTTITLDNGVKVLLKPDHSWEYLLEVSDEQSPRSTLGSATIPTSSALPVVPANTPAAGDAGQPVPARANVSAPAPAPAQARLNASALANPTLLSEGHRDGVVARLTAVDIDDGDAVLRFEIQNTAGQNVIATRARLRLYGDDGRLLATREAPLWVGEYRLPETYLRPGQTREGRSVRIALPDGSWSRQLVRVEVSEVEFR